MSSTYLGWPIAPSYMSPNAGEGGSCGVSYNEYSCAQSHGAQINFADLTPYITYVCIHWEIIHVENYPGSFSRHPPCFTVTCSWLRSGDPQALTIGCIRRQIRLIEGYAKCRHLETFTCKGTFRHVFICLRPRTPYHPPLTHCIRVYSMLIYRGKGGRVEPERRLEGQQFTKLGRK